MIVNLRRSGVKKYKKGKRIVTYLETKMDGLTQPNEVVIAPCARQSATGGFNWRSDWTSSCGDMDFYVAATATILGCFWW